MFSRLDRNRDDRIDEDEMVVTTGKRSGVSIGIVTAS